MRRWRNSIGIGAGRATAGAMRLAGRNSTALPGYVAERIGREPLGQLLKKRHYAKTILVTGTNGKTTTTMLVAKLLRAAGLEVVNNGSGSNLSRGVLTALLSDKRQGEKTVLLLEVDEASMPAVCRAASPDIIVVLNIFRDQLDRYGEVDTTRRLLEESLKLAPDAELVLCADDPHVARLGLAGPTKTHYFGLDLTNVTALANDHASDVPLSPTTNAPLVYKTRYFGHVGVYRAADNSFMRPAPDVVVTEITQNTDSQSLKLKAHKRQSLVLQSPLLGLYNAYNIAAAVTVAGACGLRSELITSAIESTSSAFGRQETITYNNTRCKFMLIKNPTGFNQVIQAFFQGSKKVCVVIVINDNFADGRDVSWLWDAAVEDMKSAGEIIVSGLRAYDMALRLEYAGKPCEVIPDPMDALAKACSSASDEVYVLPTYTALLEMRKQLSLKLEHSA